VAFRSFLNAPKTGFKETGWEGVGWIYVAQDRSKWWNLVKKVMKIRLPENVGTFQLAEEILASQEGLRSVSL
jgi:hypothetical protein